MGDLVRIAPRGRRIRVANETTVPAAFRPGDPVYLKSNGCRMTVESILTPGDACVCVWHDDGGLPQRETYLAATLVLHDEAGERARKAVLAARRRGYRNPRGKL